MDGGSDDRSPGVLGPVSGWVREGARGMTLPVPLLLSTAVGTWLMFSRVTVGNSGSMADSDHLIGALVVTFSIIAFSEVGRSVRWLNVPLGLWLLAAPWLLDGAGSALAVWNGILSGLLLVALALPRGAIRESYAGWNRYIV